ncbi:hypothetical protein BJV74DRAFT_823932, partial [Russula compacta]
MRLRPSSFSLSKLLFRQRPIIYTAWCSLSQTDLCCLLARVSWRISPADQIIPFLSQCRGRIHVIPIPIGVIWHTIGVYGFNGSHRFGLPPMSFFKLDSFPRVNDVSKTVSGIGIPSPNPLNRKPEKSQRTTGLLSGFGWATSKASPTISDKLLKRMFSILSLCFSILRRFIPSVIWNFLKFIIPPLLAFYELALRVYFPLLPSVFTIAFKLYQRGILTIDTIIWLASSLPADFLGGLGAISGVAMQTTAAFAGGAAAVGNALVGTTAGIVGDATKAVTQGINLLNPGVIATDITQVLSGEPRVAGQVTSIAAAGVNGAAVLAEGARQAVTGGLSLVNNGQTVVAENIAQLVSGERSLSTGPMVPDIAKGAIQAVVGNANAITGTAIGATQAAATENVTRLTNALESVNPLHTNTITKGSQDTDQKQPISGEQAISERESSLIPDIANGAIQTVIGSTNATADAAMQSATVNVTKVANVLQSVNPLHLNIIPKGFQDSQRNLIESLPNLPGL